MAASDIAHNKTARGKSYRMFVEWLIEAYYLRLFLGLSHIPHFTTLQKFTDRINNSLLEKIISSFIVIRGTKHIFAGTLSYFNVLTNLSDVYCEPPSRSSLNQFHRKDQIPQNMTVGQSDTIALNAATSTGKSHVLNAVQRQRK